MQSALYLGKLRQRRFSPREHQFTYPLFMAFGESHNYRLTRESQWPNAAAMRDIRPKHMGVLPFRPPGLLNFDAPPRAGVLLKSLLGYRRMALTAAIYWAALKPCIKGVPVYAHERKPARQGVAISKGPFSG